jgi:hypothetical protein
MRAHTSTSLKTTCGKKIHPDNAKIIQRSLAGDNVGRNFALTRIKSLRQELVLLMILTETNHFSTLLMLDCHDYQVYSIYN